MRPIAVIAIGVAEHRKAWIITDYWASRNPCVAHVQAILNASLLIARACTALRSRTCFVGGGVVKASSIWPTLQGAGLGRQLAPAATVGIKALVLPLRGARARFVQTSARLDRGMRCIHHSVGSVTCGGTLPVACAAAQWTAALCQRLAPRSIVCDTEFLVVGVAWA